MQWKNEVEAHSEGLSVLVWHGASRETDVKQLKKYDVVCLTTTWDFHSINLLYLGPHNLCCTRELFPEATFRLQTKRYDREGEIPNAPNQME